MIVDKKQTMYVPSSRVALIIWLITIFIFSAQPAVKSDELSKGIAEKIIEIVCRWTSSWVDSTGYAVLVAQINHIVRKWAHGIVYFILGILSVNAFRYSTNKGYKVFVYSIILCTLYSISDEVHQIFVPGRSCQFSDVLIDVSGALLGIGLFFVIIKMHKVLIAKAKA